jgi:hypothetical protein
MSTQTVNYLHFNYLTARMKKQIIHLINVVGCGAQYTELLLVKIGQ